MSFRKFAMKSFLVLVMYLTIFRCHGKIMRNNALMQKMITTFQKDSNPSIERQDFQEFQDPKEKFKESLVTVMQKVLCKHFPSVPCSIIMRDDKLMKLIGKSIEQMYAKKLSVENSALPISSVAPPLNADSQDLKKFLYVSDTGYFEGLKQIKDSRPISNKRKRKKNLRTRTHNVEAPQENRKNGERAVKHSKHSSAHKKQKKLRKFYPHKIKYKDKIQNMNKDLDNSHEKLSVSVEIPDMTLMKNDEHLNYKEPGDQPIWRIDYMKHGEPRLNMYNQESQLEAKLAKTGLVEEQDLQPTNRKEVLHPDVYIKKNMLRKTPIDLNSQGLD